MSLTTGTISPDASYDGEQPHGQTHSGWSNPSIQNIQDGSHAYMTYSESTRGEATDNRSRWFVGVDNRGMSVSSPCVWKMIFTRILASEPGRNMLPSTIGGTEEGLIYDGTSPTD